MLKYVTEFFPSVWRGRTDLFKTSTCEPSVGLLEGRISTQAVLYIQIVRLAVSANSTTDLLAGT